MKLKVLDLQTRRWSDPFDLDDVIRGDADMEWNGGESTLPWSDYMLFSAEYGKITLVDENDELRKEAIAFSNWIAKKDFRWDRKNKWWWKFGQHEYPTYTTEGLYNFYKRKKNETDKV